MKVIPQLVLIVISSSIRTSSGTYFSDHRHGYGESVLSGGELSGPGAVRKQRSSGFERDFVMSSIESAGYPAELHIVTTRDGYILKVHRIPDPALQNENEEDEDKDAPRDKNAPNLVAAADFRGVVLLMHGLFSTAADFIVTGPENGLAFILADAGYDVWLANARGTRFSRKNLNVGPKTAAFWDFSWHEIGTIDLPAIIDYILRQTGHQKLFYIGHNQGVTAVLALLADKPKYNRKIHTVAGMAPLAFLGNGVESGIAQNLVKFNDQLWVTLNSLNIYELTPSEKISKFLGGFLCSEDAPTSEMCSNVLTELFGYSAEQAKLLLPGVLDVMLTGISTKQLQFDYKNYLTNMQRYRQVKPPEYNLSKISVPFTLFYGTRDFLTSPMDFQKLTKELPSCRARYELPNWNHMDFIYNAQVYLKVYSKILQTMQNVSTGM
ncbi:hypothetical protein quinque_008253 [Culex quinquefasciatus]